VHSHAILKEPYTQKDRQTDRRTHTQTHRAYKDLQVPHLT